MTRKIFKYIFTFLRVLDAESPIQPKVNVFNFARKLKYNCTIVVYTTFKNKMF